MSYSQLAALIAAGALVVLVIFIIPVLLQVRRAIKAMGEFIEKVEKEVLPSLNKMQTTVEEVNAELAKINEATASVQAATKRVENIATLVQEVVSSPLIKIVSFSAGLQGALRRILNRRRGMEKRAEELEKAQSKAEGEIANPEI